MHDFRVCARHVSQSLAACLRLRRHHLVSVLLVNLVVALLVGLSLVHGLLVVESLERYVAAGKRSAATVHRRLHVVVFVLARELSLCVELVVLDTADIKSATARLSDTGVMKKRATARFFLH